MGEDRETDTDGDVEGHRILPLEGDASVPAGAGDRMPPRAERSEDDEDVEGHWGQAGAHIPPPKRDK